MKKKNAKIGARVAVNSYTSFRKDSSDHKGTIIMIDKLTLKILLDKGQVVTLPYSAIRSINS